MKLTEITHAGEPLLFSMLRKLAPVVKGMKMDYASLSFDTLSPVMGLEIEGDVIELKTLGPSGAVWAASIPVDHAENFTIKTYRSYGEKRWVLIRRDIADQVEDLPGQSES